MAATPYILPREKRESAVAVGNGTVGPFGPSTYKIFDTADVTVWAKATGETVYTDVTASCTIAKTNPAAAYDTFSVTFGTAVPASTSWYHQARRTAERSVAVTKAGVLVAAELEKELSKQASAQSELRRDVDRAVTTNPGVDPIKVLPGALGHIATFDAEGNIIDSGTTSDNLLALLIAVVASLNAFWLAVLQTTTFAAAWLMLKVNGSLPTRALIKAIVPQAGMSVLLTESGRVGNFVWTLGDCTALAALDTLEGVVLKADSVAINVGAWLRTYDIAKPEMWGAVGASASAANAAVPNDYAALQCMLNVVGFTGGAIQITPGRKFGTATALFARITRQQAAVKALQADVYISDKSSFKIYSDGSGQLVAKAVIDTILTFQFNSNVVGGVTNARGPDQSEAYGLMLDGNSLAAHGLKGDFTRGLNFHDNTIFDTTGSSITWLGSSAGYVNDNILKAPIGIECSGGAGGDLKIGPNQYFFPLAGGRAVKIQDSGNIVIKGGTVNSESIASVIGVEIEATAGHNVRHITVKDMEFSGCQIGVYAHTATAAERIYGLVIEGNHTTSGSGFDRASINPGCLVDLQRCDEVVINDNLCNGRALSVASDTAFLLRSCRDVQVDGAMIEGYTGEAAYIQGCDNVQWRGGSVRDVGQGGAGGAIFDLDGSTNCSINPHRVVQSNVAFGQIGIIERAGSSGNSSDRVDWSGVGTPSSIVAGTNGRFRRYKAQFAEGKVTQVAGGPTLTFAVNCTAARPSIGRTTITFGTAHPTATGYRVNVTGVGCKVEVESVAAASFVVLMLDLADSPVDSSFMFEVISAA